jgi:MFS family permease
VTVSAIAELALRFRSELLQHLLIMAIALSLGGLLWDVAVDRARRRGVGPRALMGLVATMFIAAQLALILRWPLPSYLPWIVVVAVGAGTVLSYSILAEYFPMELAGRANAALNLFHISGAFVVQYMTGLVLQLWDPTNGHYPEIAYQTAFAFNIGLQIVAGIWFVLTLKPLQAFELRSRQPFLKSRCRGKADTALASSEVSI